MKILWVNPSFLDYRIPVYKRLWELCNREFYIIFSHNRVPERIPHKIHKAIGNNAICFEGEKVIEIGKNEMANRHIRIPYTTGLYKQIKKINADIVIAEGFFQWTPQALKYTIFNKKPLLISYERTKHTERHCPKWRSLYRKIVDKYTNGYLCNGSLTKEYLEYIGVNPKKIFIGGMSADSKGLAESTSTIKDSNKESLRKKLKLNGGITYIYVGQLIERKGVIYLLNAWRKHILKHKQDNLLIVGTGSLYKEFCKNFSNTPSIIFTGNIEYDHIYQYYAISDVFIIPTLEDNWSLVVPEAMACGLPIACSIYNGCYPELIHENINGKLFDPLKENSIIETLDYFHDKNLQTMGTASINIEKKFNADTVANNIYNACKFILNEK